MATPGDKLPGTKAKGTPSPGLEVTAADVVYDVTAWRQAIQSLFDTTGALAQLVNSNANPLGVDLVTRTLMFTDYEHHEIHSGSHFQLADYALNQSSSAVIEFVLTVPDSTKWPHLVFEFSASEGATLEIYEGPTGIVGGTPVVPLNNNFNSDNTSLVSVLANPTSIADDGERLLGFIAGGGRTAGFNSRSRENILKQNTVYLFRITSLAVSNDIGYIGQWYEHTNKTD